MDQVQTAVVYIHRNYLPRLGSLEGRDEIARFLVDQLSPELGNVEPVEIIAARFLGPVTSTAEIVFTYRFR